jgi:hypothetical protein
VNELDLEEEALVPTTNLIENVHSSMWVSTKNGHKVKINLYIITMDEVCVATINLSYVFI